MPLPANENNPEYVAYLANSIQKIYQTAPTPTLVLFNSQALLAAVYQKLNKRIPAQILASNISGSREKKLCVALVASAFNYPRIQFVLGGR